MPLRLIFMGTPDFAVPTLAALSQAGHEIAAVYTRAPKPGGRRGLELQDTPVAREARRLGIPVFMPKTLKGAEDEIRAHRADATIVVAYGLILPKAVLEVPKLGCFNVHASLLPRWRGAAPINRAIMAGDEESGISIMRMDEGLDTGPVIETAAMKIAPDMTAGELHDAMAELGAKTMVRALSAVERGSAAFAPQSENGVTYANKISKDETRIDWKKPAGQVHNHIRGLSPFPGAWCEIAGARVKILRSTRAKGEGAYGTVLDDELTIACGEGAVRLVQVQREGKKPMSAAEFLRGTKAEAGTRIV
jgi:methionyl-tRNA formyltransferase